jgi:hypothetical protein
MLSGVQLLIFVVAYAVWGPYGGALECSWLHHRNNLKNIILLAFYFSFIFVIPHCLWIFLTAPLPFVALENMRIPHMRIGWVVTTSPFSIQIVIQQWGEAFITCDSCKMHEDVYWSSA